MEWLIFAVLVAWILWLCIWTRNILKREVEEEEEEEEVRIEDNPISRYLREHKERFDL